MNTIAALLLSLYLSFNIAEPAKPAPARVVVKITDIRSSSGNLKLGLYKEQTAFEDETPLLKKTVNKTGISGGVVSCDMFLEPGNYGIALLDDENNDGEMDYGFLLPDEGFGFSNYYHTGFSKPKLKNFTFTVTHGQTAYVTIKVKYM
ncbi:MAG: DUF2141 domain-containing protein [Sphingobacteriales bacterium JAD_PAG50586_3]|nr:MAG: DUF2141 domain-containing protein [Sphingobacteriales bacterium JAD_PAG50586_3]